MNDIFFVLVSATLINNIVLEQLIGVDPALGATQRLDVAWGMAKLMLVLLPLITLLAWLLIHLILIPLNLEYLQTLTLVMLMILLNYSMKAWMDKIFQLNTSIFLPWAGVNVTVLGTVLLSQSLALNLPMAFAFGIGTALGFGLFLIMFTTLNHYLKTVDVPAPFRGLPVILITLGGISIAFLGFSGIS